MRTSGVDCGTAGASVRFAQIDSKTQADGYADCLIIQAKATAGDW